MADETPDPRTTRDDSPEERTEGLARFYGTAPVTYEAISARSRDHTRQATADASAQGWMPLGPRNVGGAVRCIAQNPRRPLELIAGSAQSGIWKTIDDGYTWSQIATDTVFGSVASIAYASGDTRIIYAGTGEASYRYPGGVGFFRSKDGGATFEQLVDASLTDAGSALHYARIVVDPADDEQAWIASDRGLWRLNGTSFTLETITGLGANVSVTDVAVALDPTNANQYLILAGVFNVGVASGVFNRRSKTTVWTVVGPGAPAPWAGGVAQVRVAWAGPPNAYAVVGVPVPPPPPTSNATPSVLFRTTTSGASWASVPGALVPENQLPITWYVLSLAVNPRNPAHVLVGCVNVSSTTTNGVAWTTALDWTRFDSGDRAQHADQTSIVFDLTRPNAVWVANDGGVSFSADSSVAAPVWRKRSFGITAGQLFDITTHPRFPSIVGGGMQDNGTFVSYGGPTWYRLDGGDGGALAFHPTSPFRFYTSNQQSISRVDVSQIPPAPPAAPGAPPLNASTLPDVAAPRNVHAPFSFALQGLAPTSPSFFMRALEGNGFIADFVLLGATNAAQYATDAATLVSANLAGLVGNITAVALPPNGTDMYAGSDRGELYFNTAALPASNSGAAQPAWTARRRMPGPISAIAIHAGNVAVIAVATAFGGGPPGVFLSHDRGAHWVTITGAANALPPSPFLSLAFDPVDPRTLYVGTLSGVYVARDLPAFALAAPADVAVPALPAVAPPPPAVATPPSWQSYIHGLPFVPITDLSVNPVTQTLRCATFGRGAFEANITATPAQFALPAVSLVIRNNAFDDGRPYVAPNVLTGDPRLGTGAPPGGPPPPPINPATPDAGAAIDVSHSIDIRVDSPRFRRLEPFAFGEQIDGSEFDETLVSDEPLVGEENIVYVQVQNRGTETANNVDVHLYFADAGNPIVPPAITADFGFPNAPPAASGWQRVSDPITIGAIRPGEPAVATFRWTPPLTIRVNAALFAVATNAQDHLAAIPANIVGTFVAGERRAALFVTHVQRDTIIIRDGLDDIGDRGAVPWGGRSPDIIVRQAQVPPANFAAEFADLAASHAEDRAKPGQNFVYVRVSNRTDAVVPQSTVRLLRIPRASIRQQDATWQPVAPAAGVVLNNIPAHGSLVAEFGFALPPDPDPDGSADGKGIILLAMANAADAAGTEVDPFPDFADITDVSSFWRFFTGAPLGNNAAMRALRFAP